MTDETHLKKLLTAYQNIRLKRSEIKRDYDEKDSTLRRKLELIETAIMVIMKHTGSDQLKVSGTGLAYLTDKVRVSGSDWNAIWQFIQESGKLDLLQRRLSSRAVLDFLDENKGEIPPGVVVSVEKSVVVKRA